METTDFAFVFPGQGSQAVGMLADLAQAFPQVAETFAQASERLGFDLWRLVENGPADDLNQTRNTQPAMLCAGVATWRVWKALGGPEPQSMAGHSLGEYSALVCADALDFSAAVVLVAERGRLMQQAVPEGSGAMAAILGLDDAKVEELCAEAAGSQVVAAANYNSPGQVVVAGDRAAVTRMIELAKAAGAKRALPLPVSVPSHCALMKPAAQELRQRLATVEIRLPRIPVVHNVNVAPGEDAEDMRELLERQLYNPVRWVETVQSMRAQSVQTIVECGPGKVLSGLNKRIDRGIESLALFDRESMNKTLEALQHAGE